MQKITGKMENVFSKVCFRIGFGSFFKQHFDDIGETCNFNHFRKKSKVSVSISIVIHSLRLPPWTAFCNGVNPVESLCSISAPRSIKYRKVSSKPVQSSWSIEMSFIGPKCFGYFILEMFHKINQITSITGCMQCSCLMYIFHIHIGTSVNQNF